MVKTSAPRTVESAPMTPGWFAAASVLLGSVLGTVYFGVLFVVQVRAVGGDFSSIIVFLFPLALNFASSFVVVSALRLRRDARVSDSLLIVGAANLIALLGIGLVIYLLSVPNGNAANYALRYSAFGLIYLAAPGLPGAFLGALLAVKFTEPRTSERKAKPWTS